MHDAEKLLELCEGDFDDTSEYQLLIRLLKEQTIFNDDGTRRLREKKEKGESIKSIVKSILIQKPHFEEKLGANI